jgi:hypothetical protein
MALTISSLKQELYGILHDTSDSRIFNLQGVWDRAARQVMLDLDLFETKRTQQIATPIYDKVYNYAVPSDLKMNKVLDLRAQVNRTVADNVDQTFTEEFDLRKENNTFTIEYINGVKTLRFSKDIGQPQRVIDAINETTGWVVGNDATNITLDTQYYISGSAALNFDLSGAGVTGHVEKTLTTAIDLSEDEDIASLFLYVYLPDSSIMTSFDLRWGNDNANYWNRTVTQPHNRASFQDGWNLLRFDWNGATETGAPAAATTDYLRFTVNYDGTAETDIRIDSLTSNRGQIYEMVYYSNALFQDTTGTLLEATTADTDTVILEGQSMNVFLYKAAELGAQQIQEQGGTVDLQYYQKEYERARKKYATMFPSEHIKPKSFYYRMGRPTNQRATRIIS